MSNNEIRIVLNTADFQDLVRGKEIRGNTREDCLATTTNVKIILSDIGFSTMLKAIGVAIGEGIKKREGLE
jgi:hypothetical protein